MPGFDGSGPYGDGRPGRGLGPCGRFGRNYDYGRRGLRNFGRRNRWFRNDYPVVDYYDQPINRESFQARKRELESEIKWLEDEMEQMQKKNQE